MDAFGLGERIEVVKNEWSVGQEMAVSKGASVMSEEMGSGVC